MLPSLPGLLLVTVIEAPAPAPLGGLVCEYTEIATDAIAAGAAINSATMTKVSAEKSVI